MILLIKKSLHILRNKKIFKTDQGGKLVKDDSGSLTKLKYDN